MSESAWPEAQRSETILFAPFPEARAEFIAKTVEDEFALLEGVVSALRNIRGELRVNKNTPMEAGVIGAAGEQAAFLRDFSGAHSTPRGPRASKL